MEETKKKRVWLYVVYGLVALAIILSIQFTNPFEATEISYSEFLARLNAGEVNQVTVTDTRIEGTSVGEGGQINFVTSRIPNTDDQELINQLTEKGVEFSGRVENTFWRDFLLTWMLPLGLIVFIWFFVFRRLSRRIGGAGPMSFGQSKVKLYDRSIDRVIFEDRKSVV